MNTASTVKPGATTGGTVRQSLAPISAQTVKARAAAASNIPARSTGGIASPAVGIPVSDRENQPLTIVKAVTQSTNAVVKPTQSTAPAPALPAPAPATVKLSVTEDARRKLRRLSSVYNGGSTTAPTPGPAPAAAPAPAPVAAVTKAAAAESSKPANSLFSLDLDAVMTESAALTKSKPTAAAATSSGGGGGGGTLDKAKQVLARHKRRLSLTSEDFTPEMMAAVLAPTPKASTAGTANTIPSVDAKTNTPKAAETASNPSPLKRQKVSSAEQPQPPPLPALPDSLIGDSESLLSESAPPPLPPLPAQFMAAPASCGRCTESAAALEACRDELAKERSQAESLNEKLTAAKNELKIKPTLERRLSMYWCVCSAPQSRVLTRPCGFLCALQPRTNRKWTK